MTALLLHEDIVGCIQLQEPAAGTTQGEPSTSGEITSRTKWSAGLASPPPQSVLWGLRRVATLVCLHEASPRPQLTGRLTVVSVDHAFLRDKELSKGQGAFEEGKLKEV